jgi:hypothetical protein
MTFRASVKPVMRRRRGLYVDYAGASPTRRYPLARFSPVPDDHILAHVWKDKVFTEGASSVPFRSGGYMPCHCEARPLGPFVAGILSFGNAAAPRGQLAFDL